VDEKFAGIETVVSWPGVVGYINFSRGKPDARFRKQLNEAFDWLQKRGVKEPWLTLKEVLRNRLEGLRGSRTPGFEDVSQAEAVLVLTYSHLLPAYRQHHRDLLFHQSDRDLFRPFFLARAFEAVLAQGGPWEQTQRIVKGALVRLNDFVGYRPIAILETRPRGEPYDHERVCPIPLFLRDSGVAVGRYREVLVKAMEILEATDAGLLQDAGLDPRLLDEVALDPRAYDHGHPLNRRPNYVFGEWDPHLLDNQGRFRRYVVRQASLDALMERCERPQGFPREEMLLEGAAVLAGTMLMGAAITGGSPTAHDSSASLGTLMPRIAHLRDQFYEQLLARLGGPHAERLQREVQQTRQPFAAARQHLNQHLAQDRAAQLQQRFLSLLFAEMGYPDASREEAARIPAPSVRILSEIFTRLTTARMRIDLHDPAQGPAALTEVARLLPEVEDLLRRGIHCGALVDPWNILGFQGLFPLSAAQEDGIRDTRVDELLQIIAYHLSVYARLMSEAAATGQKDLVKSLGDEMRRFAVWWDRFASVEVGDVRHVHGNEAVDSAEHVALALGHWQERGKATADLAFWKQHLEDFHSPKAFALVVEALLRKEDYRSALALLVNWVSHVEQVPLEDGEHSFHALALRWMLGWTGQHTEAGTAEAHDHWALIRRFFDYLEANADEYWHPPALELGTQDMEDDAEEDIYSAAYDDVTYQDSADDGEESMVSGSMPREEFDLDSEAERLEKRLRFLGTLSRLWLIASRSCCQLPPDAAREEVMDGWLAQARANRPRLLALMQDIHQHQVPEPTGSFDSVVEYDRRRVIKEQLLHTIINASLDTTLAIGALQSARGHVPQSGGDTPAWEPHAIRIEQAILRADAPRVRELLPGFLAEFRQEPLIFTALATGGSPQDILRVRLAQTILRALTVSLPRLGLLRETYHLVKSAYAMEQASKLQGRGVTEFNFLFQAAFQAVVEAVVLSSETWEPWRGGDGRLAEVLEQVTTPFLTLWIEHSKTLQLASLEGLRGEREWQALRLFVQRYGGDLFGARFMALGNLRGIVHRGAGPYLDYLHEHPNPLQPIRLIEDIDRGKIARADAEKYLTIALQAVIENYEEYKDYKSTATQSDYGENLHMLLDFLRLKANYDRHAWNFRPLVLAHEVLARENRPDAALQWEENFTRVSREMSLLLLADLARLEQAHGLRLRTIADHLQERFVKPLGYDRTCALIEPAMLEARQPAEHPAFDKLRAELKIHGETPTGVGLDVPHWLRQLENEVRRVHASQSSVAMLADDLFRIPAVKLSFDELHEQLDQWEGKSEES
jgi:hypothetical protein